MNIDTVNAHYDSMHRDEQKKALKEFQSIQMERALQLQWQRKRRKINELRPDPPRPPD